MTFQQSGRMITLQGDTTREVELLDGRTLGTTIKKGANVAMLSVTSQEDNDTEQFSFMAYLPESDIENRMRELLYEFNDLFQEPTSLPLTRSYDHRICLKEGAQTVS